MKKTILERIVGRIRLTCFFKNRFTRKVLFVCGLVLFIVPILDICFIYPLFNKILLQTVEDETEHSAQNLLAFTLSSETVHCSLASFPPDFPEKAKELVASNNLVMLKLYDSNGKILFCTKSELIGTKHPETFFYEIVQKGQCLTQFVRQKTPSLEKDFFDRDVVESYIPIMKDDKFCGAFEIYHDATSFKSEIDKVNAFVILLIMAVTGILVAIVAFVAIKLDSTESQLHIINQAIQKSPQAVVIFTSDGIIEAINSKFTELTGYQEADLLGNSLTNIYVKSPEKYKKFWSSLNLGTYSQIEFYEDTDSPRKRYLKSSMLLIRNQYGVTTHILGIFEDLQVQYELESELNDFKQTYKSVVDTLDVGLFTIDDNGEIISTNRWFNSLFGYTDSAPVGKPITTIVPELKIDVIRTTRSSPIAKPQSQAMTGKLKNGHEIFLNLSMTKIQLAGKHIYSGVIHTLKASRN